MVIQHPSTRERQPSFPPLWQQPWRRVRASSFGCLLLLAACSSSGGTAASGGSAASSGTSGSGPTSNSGGSSASSGAADGDPANSSAGRAGSDPSAGSGNFGGAPLGAGGGGADAGASGARTGSFELAWQDDFNSLDPALWELEDFTFEGNQAVFTPANAKAANGVLNIALTPAPSGSAKPYLGVEARSTKTLTFGKVSARMRFAKGSGVVSGLVLFYTPYPNCDWNEIDIEHLGKTSTSSQLNAMVFLGQQVPTCTASVSPTQDPLLANLGFDAEADYHVYDIEWTPTSVKYLADGVLLRTWTKNIALLQRPQNILLTIWASNSASWAGALTATSAPTSADVDWIKVYDWKP